MTMVLRQMFPLGRFHATPWKVFPFEDPYGEWPPSPWRFLRAILARSYQWEREGGTVDNPRRDALIRAFCSGEISWHLPSFVWRGPGLRQYHPSEFSWVPKSRTKTVKGEKVLVPGERTYATTLARDNFWLVGNSESNPEESAIWWLIEGTGWSPDLLTLLDACLARMTYFGRAESITDIERVKALPDGISVNCQLRNTRAPQAVPVLAPLPDATPEQIQATSDDQSVAEATVPPGAQWLFAVRPVRPPVKLPPPKRKPTKPVSFVQFAIGARVSPPRKSIVILTQRFRGRVLRHFLGGTWQQASIARKEEARLLAGKNADGQPTEGHQHARFFIYFDEQTSKAARLIVWRSEPFTDAEQRAIFKAAEHDLQIAFEKAGRKDPWTIRLVPLDSQVPPPIGFDAQAYCSWRTSTLYVPSRHVFDRRGRIKPGEAPDEQIREELQRQGFETSNVRIEVESGPAQWAAIHRSHRERYEPTNAQKRGYHVSLVFSEPTRGPIALGHSSHFGLGLFVPVRPMTL